MHRLLALAFACGAAFLVAPARAQGVTVALVPPSSQVVPGATFELELFVPSSGSAFNAFDAVIGFDPAALTLQPLAPVSLQEGALMTGVCGQTFHFFQVGPSSASITDVLLCGAQAVTGPGQIYRLRFVASLTPQVTEVRFLPGLKFYNDGLFVQPATSSNALVGIGMPPVDVAPPALAPGVRLRIAPNPARAAAVFTSEADCTGLRRITVMDPKGRVVRRLEQVAERAGALSLSWDGRDDRGSVLPAGIYVVRLEVEGRSSSSRLAMVR